MAVTILTDTGCDLPSSIMESLNIEVMPLIVYLDDVEYQDERAIDPKDFFNKMREGLPTRTAQISPDTIKEKFLQYKSSQDEVIYISLSSGLSGTYNTANVILNSLKEDFELNIQILDSKSASIGFGLVVYHAALLAQSGGSVKEIIAATQKNISQIEHIFTVDDLEYLYRGGRVSRGAAIVGSMLNIKPILEVVDGKLVALQKIRGRKKAMKRMLEIMAERGSGLDQQVVAINHGDDIEAVNELKEAISKKFGTKEFIVNYVGCAIGAHSGPGTLSVFFFNNN